MAKEYIERDEAIGTYCENICDYLERCPFPCAPVGAVKQIPAADVAPVVHGRWIVINDCDGHRYYSTAITVTPDNYDIVRDEHPGYSEPMCSECHGKALLNGAEEYVLSAFCPNCGAKMNLEFEL